MKSSTIKSAQRISFESESTGFNQAHTVRMSQGRAIKPNGRKICLGMPLYNQTQFLHQAIESILFQTHRDFKLVAVDDSTDPGPGEIVKQYALRDSRITYHKNANRKGLIDNWKTSFQLAGNPDYFAWISDHDVWHPEWLESMVLVLNQNPGAVLVYPKCVSIDLAGSRQPKKRPFEFSTEGLSETDRIMAVCREARGYGNMVYGLFRAKALRQAGVFRRVLFPDAILMHELCQRGNFIQVDAELWYRRSTAKFSIKRQKKALFIRKPWYIWLPWPLVNAAVLAWNSALHPQTGGLRQRYWGLKAALMYLARQIGRMGKGSWFGSYDEWRRGKKPWMKKLKKRFKNRT